MGIGTSDGNYYDDEFHAAAADWNPDYDTNNLRGSVDDTKASAISIKPVKEEKATEEPYNGHPIIDKLFGINGAERYQTWPERAIRDMGKAFDVASKVSKGEIPMWAQDPETGEFHTSIEGMESARELMPLAMSGQIPLRIHLGQPSSATTLRSLSAEQDAFDAIIRNYRREGWQEPVEHDLAQSTRNYQERAIANGSYTVAEQAERNVQSFTQELESMISEAHAAGETWQPVGIRHGESVPDFARRSIHEGSELEALGEVESYASRVEAGRRLSESLGHSGPNMQPHSYEPRTSPENRRLLEEIRSQYATFSEKTKALMQDSFAEGNVHLARLKPHSSVPETHHSFKFFHEETGTVGHLDINEIHGGKRLYVNGIGLFDAIDPQKIGFAGMKDMLYALKKEFPHATEVAGFRVSGARKISGKGAAPAVMKLPTRPRQMGHNNGPPLED